MHELTWRKVRPDRSGWWLGASAGHLVAIEVFETKGNLYVMEENSVVPLSQFNWLNWYGPISVPRECHNG